MHICIVDGGYRAIKYSRFSGLKEAVYGEGTHLKLPWIERPIFYEVRAKPRTIASLTCTKGLEFHNDSSTICINDDQTCRSTNGRHYH